MKAITIRTANKAIAESIYTTLSLTHKEHINFIWWDGAWELGLEGDDEEIDGIAICLWGDYSAKEVKYEVETI